MHRWSLKARVAALAALLVIALAGSLAVWLPARLAEISFAWAESRALVVARIVATTCAAPLDRRDARAAEALLAGLGESGGALGIALLTADGSPLAQWGEPPGGPLAGAGPEASTASDERIRVRVPVALPAGAPGTLVLDVPPRELMARAREMRRILLAGLVVALVAGVLGAGAIGAVTARPLQRMTAVARRIADGDLSARADLERRGSAEACALADALDAMLQRLYGQQALLSERARAIAGLNADLERRVVERTAELEAANRALAERIAEVHGTQEQLIVADRRVAVGRLAAGVAHEINNPLAYVSSNLRAVEAAIEALARELPPDAGARLGGGELDEARSAIADALDGAERVRQIVRSLRTFSRGDEDAREHVAVEEALAAALGMAQHEMRHRARLEQVLDPAPRVLASAVRLSQVFLNLLVNAAQAIPEGNPAAHRIRVSVGTTQVGWAIVEIEDDGVGIAPGDLSRVFDPFFTTKAVGEGTGLGLSISQGIVNALGGRISCESALGKGTTFRVVLPPAVGDRPAKVLDAAPLEPLAPRRRVLVVDDEPLVGSAVRRALRGHHVRLEESGHGALRLIALGERFDRIICDVMMPGMDGFAFAEALARINPEQASRVVFMTGGVVGDRAVRLQQMPPGRVLEKPLDLARLRALVADPPPA